jgi:ubiquinone/menaquinone biosynthesis C-methylase UbiE
MLEITRKRLSKSGLIDRVKLLCGDALTLPYDDNTFNAVL